MGRPAVHDGGLAEPVMPWAGWARKAVALATVTRRGAPGLSPQEYERRVRELSRLARRGSSLSRRIWTLWRIESLTFACADRSGGSLRLGAASLPLEAGPPAACGLSMAAVLENGFDARRVTRVLEERADRRFMDFAFESLGLMLAAYERDRFGRISAALGQLGVMRRYRLASPDPAAFLAGLPAEYRPYAAHGFGRLLYFKSHGLRSVVTSLKARPHVELTPALKGAVAACVLVNGARLGRILSLADDELPADLDEGIRGGLHNVLKLLAWALPGGLDALTPSGPRSAALLASARDEARRRRRRGDGPGLRP